MAQIEIANLVTRLSFNIERAQNAIQAAEDVASAVEGISDAGSRMAEKLRQSSVELARQSNLLDALEKAAAEAERAFNALGKSVEQIEADLQASSDALTLATTAAREANTEVGELERQYNRLTEQLEAATRAEENAEKVEQLRKQSLEESEKALAAQSKAMAESKTRQGELKAVIDQTKAAIAAETAELQKQQGISRATQPKITADKAAAAEYFAAGRAMAITRANLIRLASELKSAESQLSATTLATTRALAKEAEATERVKRAREELARAAAKTSTVGAKRDDLQQQVIAAEQKLKDAKEKSRAATEAKTQADLRYNQALEASAKAANNAAAKEALLAQRRKQNATEEQHARTVEQGRRLAAPVVPPGPRVPGGGGGAPPVRMSEITSIISLLRSGNISATALTQALFRLGGTFLKALVPVGVVLGPIIAGFGFLQSKMGQLTQRVMSARPEVAGLAADFKSLSVIDLGALLGQLDQTENLLRSMSAVNPAETTGQIAQIADVLQHLDARPNNLNEAIQAVDQSLRTLNFESLRGFGVEVDQLEAEFQALADQGIGKAELRMRALARIGEIAMREQGRAAGQASREYMTLQGVIDSIKSGVNNIALDPEVQNAAGQLIIAFTTLDSTIKSMSGTFKNVLPPALRFVADLFRGLVVVVQEVVRWVANLVEGLGQLTGNQAMVEWANSVQDGINDAQHLALVLRELGQEWNASLDPQEKATRALGALAQAGASTAIALTQVQNVSGATAEDMRLAVERIRTHARELGLDAAQVKELDDAYKQWQATLPQVNNDLAAFTPTITEANDAIKKLQADIQGGFGVLDTLKGWAQAMINFNAEANPENAYALARAMEQVLNVVIDGGAAKVAALTEELRILNQMGALPDTAYQQLVSLLEASEPAIKAAGDAADNLNRKLQDESPARIFGNATSTYVEDPMAAAQTQADALAGELTKLYNKMDESASHVVQIHTAYSFSGSPGGGPGGVGGGPGGPGLPAPGDYMKLSDKLATTAQAVTTAANRLTAAEQKTARDESAARALGAAERKTAREDVVAAGGGGDTDWAAIAQGIADAAGLKPPGGGGGGGGGGATDDFAVTLEQIRALMRAVNEAIAIGIRGGVRIGTEGNLVPFEPGTFLNAQGNQLTVDTIVIRGVWDFADPATRRQIVKELEQALRELKDEL